MTRQAVGTARGWTSGRGAARLALTTVFFAVGIATGAWAACIPGLKRLAGDRMVAQLGGARTLRPGGIAAALGLALALGRRLRGVGAGRPCGSAGRVAAVATRCPRGRRA